MKELVPVLTDDLDLAEKNIRTPADLTRTVTDGKRVRELELTRAHSDELDAFLEENARQREEFIGRYMSAGRPAEKMRSGPGGRPGHPGHRGPADPVRMAYNARLRQWADRHTGEDGRRLAYRSPAGWVGYPKRLRDTFDVYEAGGDWRAFWDNWSRPLYGAAKTLHENAQKTEEDY